MAFDWGLNGALLFGKQQTAEGHPAKAKDGGVMVFATAEIAEPKTKALAENFAKLGLTNALIIDGAEPQANFCLAARNIPEIDVLPIQGLNVYDILRREKLVLTKAALAALEARFA